MIPYCLQGALAHLFNHRNGPKRKTQQEFAFGKNELDRLSRVYFSLDKPAGMSLHLVNIVFYWWMPLSPETMTQFTGTTLRF